MASQRPKPADARIGDRLRSAREKAGMSQQQVAALLDVDRSVVAKIELGRRRLSAARAKTWARLLRITLAYLLDETPEEQVTAPPSTDAV